MMKASKHISVIGDSCPIPLIRITQAFNDIAKGDILSVTGDDPMFESSICDYCEANNLEVVDVIKRGKHEVNVLIRK
ncbi:MAG: sulfurtransferase TusA family protein [Gammaproteobacteria bacterium]|nr:sulfurtransferase TusA family protein [Gammaproteobacteria bacterium]MDH5734858.1 sulfurtransferase TusA family protein [Gammaproteobacteria bacterium]